MSVFRHSDVIALMDAQAASVARYNQESMRAAVRLQELWLEIEGSTEALNRRLRELTSVDEEVG